MQAEILKIIPWNRHDGVDYCHQLMIDMLTECFQNNGSSPSMWLVVAPTLREAAVVVTAWGNADEKQASVATMRETLTSGPGGGMCPMYSFSCEALMKVVGADEYVPGTRLKRNDPRVEDIAIVSSYDKDGHGLFSRFGVSYGKRPDFGTLKARDDWDLSKPESQAHLSGLLMNLYLPDPDAVTIRCPYCHKLNDAHMPLVTKHAAPRDGDVMLCMGCGEVGTFDSAWPYGTRRPTEAELADFMTDPRVRLGSLLVKAMQK
jgi:hypothetical protein